MMKSFTCLILTFSILISAFGVHESGYIEICDWFSLGQTVLECATGKLPQEEMQLANKRKLKNVRDCRVGDCSLKLPSAPSYFPSCFNKLVVKMTCSHPSCRGKYDEIRTSLFMSNGKWEDYLNSPIVLEQLGNDSARGNKRSWSEIHFDGDEDDSKQLRLHLIRSKFVWKIKNSLSCFVCEIFVLFMSCSLQNVDGDFLLKL